jgi:hypothetical protein
LFRSATEESRPFTRHLDVLETGNRAATILYVGTPEVYGLVRGTYAEPVLKMLCSDKTVASLGNKTAISRQTSNL